MSNLLSRLESRKMPHRDVAICLDLNLLNRLNEALRRVVDANTAQAKDQRSVASPELRAARAEVADAKAAIRDASITIRITGVDRNTYNQFLLDCPPRKGHQEMYDPNIFFMHVARQTGQYVDENGNVHEMTDEEWELVDSKITDGEHDRIASAVIEVNRTVGSNNIDFFETASETTRDSSGISASPVDLESRPAVSGAGSRKKSTATK